MVIILSFDMFLLLLLFLIRIEQTSRKSTFRRNQTFALQAAAENTSHVLKQQKISIYLMVMQKRLDYEGFFFT